MMVMLFVLSSWFDIDRAAAFQDELDTAAARIAAEHVTEPMPDDVRDFLLTLDEL